MAVNISLEVQKLIYYGIQKQLIVSEDIIFTKNRLLEALGLDEIEDTSIDNAVVENAVIENELMEGKQASLQEILDNITDWAYETERIENNGITTRYLFDTKIMACLIGRPSEIIREFKRLYNESPSNATNYFYELSINSNYIRWEMVQKDLKWKADTEYGDIDITINLSKPEKDPKEIA